jgi:hypothetical protein
MGFKNLKQIVDSDEAGATSIYSFRKAPTQATVAGQWFDLSMSPGNPIPQYYAAAPLVSVAMKQSTDGGLFHGPSVAPFTKYLKKSLIMCSGGVPLPAIYQLIDYLVYYPFIDEGSTDEQFMVNSVPLPRYSDGEGVMIMAVGVAAQTGGQQFFVTYTNQDGVSGRNTLNHFQNTATSVGSLISSNSVLIGSSTPFLSLQAGDTGVRSIDSVTMLGLDVGLFTLVLVKPIAQFSILENTAPVEVEYLKDRGLVLPEIKDDAYLNFICSTSGLIQSVAIIGTLEYTWS